MHHLLYSIKTIFEFEVGNLGSHEIEITNSDLYKLSIENGPSWLRLYENDGVYYLSGKPKIEDYHNLPNKIEIIQISFVGPFNNYKQMEVKVKIVARN